MRKARFIFKGPLKLTALIVFCLIGLRTLIKLLHQDYVKIDVDLYMVKGEKNKSAQKYAEKILEQKCRQSFVQQQMAILFPHKYDRDLHPFLARSSILRDDVFKYNTPFGFKKHQNSFNHLIDLMPMVSLPEELERNPCKRCIVLGSGGILRGLGLGRILDRFDVVIRLNNAPIQGFIQDVGNKTTIRMSYPEGAPKSPLDYDPYMLFVAVMYKAVDFSWLKAMIKREQVNIPTLGVSAVVLATHLCDEVSLAGFGYNLSQPQMPLHYYENVPMNAMKAQTMHNVEKERSFLENLIKEGVVTDLSGGIHCNFCI
ncbi:lactosylceramide alpha-2,3-sialyltransferase isoform X4 [Amblyraja radiata]|uniref:lactosylceramide alpha-2,3-sialyltransferase isoform X4 n=1 Tax=Amblyraja radiata TaxID=386614 RepID=UPI001403B163|nr:lactosylceramide alpha-2,3-sialyltransferase isoform X4 [Amblyraja radiata]